MPAPLKSRFGTLYRNTVLPVLRGAVTPVFRALVHGATALGLLPKKSADESGQGYLMVVHLSSHVGDTVMLLPMIEALRNAHPAARLEIVVQAPIGEFLRHVPSLDRVHEFRVDQTQKTTPKLEVLRTSQIVCSFWRTLRRERPTTCIIPRWGCGFRDLMLAYLLQAPSRIGFASNDFDASQPPSGYRDAMLTCLVRGARGLHEPAKFIYLLKQSRLIEDSAEISTDQVSRSMLSVAASVDWEKLADRLKINPESRLAVIAPGASAARRMWPADRWASVTTALHERNFCVVLLTGGQDAGIARSIYDLLPPGRRDQTILAAGVTSLRESAALISHSALFVGNDSGPGHLAGALGKPCTVVFMAAEGADPNGPSAPERVRPMGLRVSCCRPKQAIPPCVGYCTADEPHCILEISVDEVIEGITRLEA